jgi:hypothetical protein
VSKRREHDFGFFVWAIPGFLVVFGFVTGFTIGLPFLGAGLALFLYLTWWGPTWPADLGLIAGVGAASFVFGCIALISGSYSPAPWLQIGLALVGASGALFWWLRCRPIDSSAS